jgi:metal-responsive CopG/Arc/MetJ family transcriptional regulator
MPIPKRYTEQLQVPEEEWVIERLDEIAKEQRRSRADLAREIIREGLWARRRELEGVVESECPAGPLTVTQIADEYERLRRGKPVSG